MAKASDLIGNYLSHIGSELYQGDVRLFSKFEKDDTDFTIKTEVEKGKELIDDTVNVQISHQELMEHGFHIVVDDITKRYKITRTMFGKTLKDTRGIKIMLNIRDKKVSLKGGNTDTKEMSLREGTKKKGGLKLHYRMDDEGHLIPPDFDEILFQVERQRDKLLGGLRNIQDTFQVEDRDIAFMIAVTGELVCINADATMPLHQKILVLGDSGAAKTLTMMSIFPRAFYKYKNDWWLCVDPLSQFRECYKQMQTPGFVRMIEKVGEKPIGLPRIYFYMVSKDVPNDYDNDSEFLYPLDTYEFLNKYKFFTYGVQRWNLGGAERYLSKVIPRLGHSKTKKEVEDILEEEFPPTKTKKGEQDTLKSMKQKWVETFDSIYSFKFLNVFYNAQLKWKAVNNGKEYVGSPLIASMFAGLPTFLNIDYAKRIPEDNQACSRNILANYFQNILRYKRTGSEAKKQRVWILFDELNDVYKGYSRQGDNLTKTVTEIFTQGRFQNIGFIATKQGFADLPQDLIQNSTMMIFGQIGSSTIDRTRIGKAFNLPQDQVLQLQELRKGRREIIAVQKEPFIVYDKFGNRKEGNRFYRGFLITPNCNTLKAGG